MSIHRPSRKHSTEPPIDGSNDTLSYTFDAMPPAFRYEECITGIESCLKAKLGVLLDYVLTAPDDAFELSLLFSLHHLLSS